MEVVSARSALLSNYEVLSLLRELESEHLAQQKTSLRIKKEEEERTVNGGKQDASVAHQLLQNEVCENLRTVEVEAIQYLSAEYQPSNSQSPETVTKLVRGLAQYDLTKAEKLQIVNLAPIEPVELYVIVEEIEDRFGDRMDEMLNIVRENVNVPKGITSSQPAQNSTVTNVLHTAGVDYREGWDDEDDEAVADVYDDTGAGAGIEGDLEMDEQED